MRCAWMLSAVPLALAGCGGGGDEQAVEEPPELQLTPGSWAADAELARFSDEQGNVLASFRCDAETAELMLETEGDFAEGARPAMLVRAGQFRHGIEGVEVRQGEGGPVKVARIPADGPIADTLLAATGPLTVETDGAEPVMLETDATLQGFVENCRTASEAAGGGTEIGDPGEGAAG